MSRRSARNSKKTASPNDDDDDYEVSPSSSQKTVKKASSSTLPEAQLKTLVSDVVNFVLSTVGNQKTNVKKEEICKVVLKDFSKQFPDIFDAAKVKLENVYGLKVMEVPDLKNQYMVINKHSVSGDQSHMSFSDGEYAEDGILFIILTLVFMNGNVIHEKELYSALAKLQIDSEQPHHVFGDVHKLIFKEFVKRNYLKVYPIPNSQPVEHELSWGARADAELSKMDVLEFACKVYDVYKPEQFQAQYKDAMAQMKIAKEQ